QLGAALAFVLEALKGFLEPLQALYQDISTRPVPQFRVIEVDVVEGFLQGDLQLVRLRVRQLAIVNDVRPRLGLGKHHSHLFAACCFRWLPTGSRNASFRRRRFMTASSYRRSR